jgi:hypothetical protein
MVRPFEHLSGREYLAVIRGQRREPPRPFSYDLKDLTTEEYQEVLAVTPEHWRLKLSVIPDWKTS